MKIGRYRSRRLTVPAVVAAAALSMLVAGSALATSGSPSASSPVAHSDLNDSVALSAQADQPTSVVTLITGLQVRVSGLSAVVIHRPAGESGLTIQFVQDGDLYVVPAEAVPFLNVLNPRLFDVSLLARSGLDNNSSSTIPLKITMARGRPAARLPGVTMTATPGGGDAELAKAQAARLGAAIGKEFTAYSAAYARGQRLSATVRGLLAGISQVNLALPPSAAGQPSAAGNSALGILTVKLATAGGTPPMACLVEVQNVDHVGRYFAFTGEAGESSLRYAVPMGHYNVSAMCEDAAAGGGIAAERLLIQPQVLVASAKKIVNLGETPSVPVSASVPEQATAQSVQIGYYREAKAPSSPGNPYLATMGLGLGAPNFSTPLFVSPTSRVTTGSFSYVADFVFDSLKPASGFTAPSQYLLAFPHLGSVPASQSYSAQPSDLATVDEYYYQPATAATQYQQYLIDHQPGGVPFGYFDDTPPSLTAPMSQVDYYDVPRDMSWQEELYAGSSSAYLSTPRSYRPGEHVREDWFKAPAVPVPAQTSGSVPFASQYPAYEDACAACRQDNNLALQLWPGGDSDPAHFGGDFAATPSTSTVRLYENGQFVTHALLPVVTLPLGPGTGSYQLDWDYSGTQTLSQSVQTRWSFRSQPSQPHTLPAGEKCLPDPTQGCSFVPLLFPRYDLPLTLDDSAAAPGSLPITFTMSGQPGQAPPAGVTARLWVSYDDGTTWTPVTVQSAGRGRFQATLTLPDPTTSPYASLRVEATAGHGDSVEQTVLHAFALTQNK